MAMKEVEIIVNGKFYRKETVPVSGYDITKILQHAKIRRRALEFIPRDQ